MNIIEINTEYIKLGQFLKLTGFIDSGALAKEYLCENQVFVNDELEDRRGRKLYPEYTIKIEGKIFTIKQK